MTHAVKNPSAILPTVLLALLAILMAPQRAMAAGSCIVDGVAYGSLEEAVAAAPEGTPATIVLTEDQTLVSTVIIPEGKDITIADDGTARTMTSAASLFEVKGSLTLSGSANDSLQARGTNPTNGASIALVSGNGRLTLKAATLTGGELGSDSAAAVKVKDSATFDMDGGVITGTWTNPSTNPLSAYMAPVVVADSATMNMTGGEISRNSVVADFSSSGIIVVGTVGADGSYSNPKFNMSGGSISGNTASDCSAVYVIAGAEFNLSGGAISDNKATGSYDGGAVVVDNRGKINMTGGTINNNTSEVSTVVIFHNARGSFTGGAIHDNVSYTAGGAIFVIDDMTSLTVNDAAVYGNTATIMGGGLWYCPTGAGEVNACNGMAIFSNAADGAGDDFASLLTTGKIADVYLSDKILGGGTVAYHEDGAIKPGNPVEWKGVADSSVPRFDAANPGEPVTVTGAQSGCLALKTLVSDEGQANAKDDARFVITGNTAPYGGGIACNGLLTSGSRVFNRVVEVSKQDGAGALLAGAHLQLTDIDGNVVDEWVSDDAGNHFLQLFEGTYTLTEVAAPEGYELAGPIVFTVTDDGTISIDGEPVEKVIMIDEKTEDEVPASEDNGGEGEDEGVEVNDGKTTEKTTANKRVVTVAATPTTADPTSTLPILLCVGGAAAVISVAGAKRLRRQ